jgi:hypothetical protein
VSVTQPLPHQWRESRPLRAVLRLGLVLGMGVAAALLVGCGSSGKGLLSAAEAGPLKNDIEAVDIAAQEGNGNCTATDAALQRTEQDFAALPASINSGLHDTLRQGITNLRKVATELCTQPLVRTTATQTTPASTTPASTSKEEREAKEEKAKERETQAKEEETAKEETEQPAGQGGGTPSPGEGNGKSPAEGVGGAPPEAGTGNGAGGQESGK